MTEAFFSYRRQLMDAVKAGNEEALMKLGIGIVATAKPLAPVDFGQLRNSIQWKTAKSQGGFEAGHAEIGKRGRKWTGEETSHQLTDKPEDNVLLVGATARHAIYQEYGTARNRPHPFLRPAIEKYVKGNVVKNTIKNAMDEWLNRKLKQK